MKDHVNIKIYKYRIQSYGISQKVSLRCFKIQIQTYNLQYVCLITFRIQKRVAVSLPQHTNLEMFTHGDLVSMSCTLKLITVTFMSSVSFEEFLKLNQEVESLL